MPPEKLNVTYHLRRKFEAGKNQYQILDRDFSEIYWMKELVKILFSLIFKSTFGYILRSREKYPYWQNYFVEVTGRTVGGIGRVSEHYRTKICSEMV